MCINYTLATNFPDAIKAIEEVSKSDCGQNLLTHIERCNRSYIDGNQGSNDIHAVKDDCCRFWKLEKCIKSGSDYCNPSQKQRVETILNNYQENIENNTCKEYKRDSNKCESNSR